MTSLCLMLLTWQRHMVGGLLPPEKHIIAVALQNWERQGGWLKKETGYEDLKNWSTLQIMSHRDSIPTDFAHWFCAIPWGRWLFGEGQPFWPRTLDKGGVFFFGASFIWYQWDVCSVSWYFVYLSYIYNLYTFTSSTYPCYNIIIWCKSRIYSHSYFTPYFSAFNLQIVFFFSNQQTHEIFACFLGGLEVHVAGLEVPHCRCRVDPASDFHSMDSQCFAALMDFFGVSQRDGFRWAVSKKQCFFLKTWNELKL